MRSHATPGPGRRWRQFHTTSYVRIAAGYVFAIRSERALCRDVQVNLAYRWFCGLSIEDKIPDHSAFSRAGNERFRDSDILRRVFERVVEALDTRCADRRRVG